MKIRDNDVGGQTIVLANGDRLDDVPTSHQHIITESIRQAFHDPAQYFRSVAERSPYENFRRWLEMTIASNSNWRLMLMQEEGHMMEPVWEGSFVWPGPNPTQLLVRLSPSAGASTGFEGFPSKFYSFLDTVAWADFGHSGGILRYDQHIPIDEYNIECPPMFSAEDTFIWGMTQSGDVFVYERSGKSGCISHESGQGYQIGSIDDTVEWIFGNFLATREPEFDYDRVE